MERLLDVSELEAPEPLLLAIDALQDLAGGEYLRFCHRMKPCHLYRYLEENGFCAETRQGKRCECEVLIWREDDEAAATQARAAASLLSPWPQEEG
ncbi:MAG: DUF2249 domain-containing protein [Gammaproteobacteria bacterium]|nr:DUF2249 domain-containing protein [Gammaproteobacteria bacterium]MCW8840462.1 DUF2249 domain-containing protein [Gammaproteobacteria bacterium]MCW8957833.1 DUF2249 domain-containing protein [Gammaproteobacteria bacterium]MCW8973276.1 DUF2249 domain-containing protein [Gammaproteobacteria bacterium]MCW8992847.1 DUF2249 domain-containing protein [Gammaproteobacteria bacterium]